ncbi:SDR family oxidoreductase [Algoriphagus sp. NG3]|uniref:SDR family NAD(P)-dependent oxidoreductase n=1 Tax=unclassified Algoriphagus TaxID=2641541 RepID=UPI002A81592A|nr:SDR family oxidoreductase [Algoriphagus sp. NG3]WPR75962.1 SDR family oxidoreductase [Algoriphagus sp. NG3]
MKTKKTYALITGATSGIGYELALLFAQNGYNLIIVSRDLNELQAKAIKFKDCGVDVKTIQADLFDTDSAFAVCEQAEAMGVDIDILVNDAAQGLYGKFEDTDIRRELDIINLNISSLVILTKHFVRKMTAKKSGKILNLSSIAGKAPGPWQSVYHGTKAFVLSFTEAIRHEVQDRNVTVTALLPGATDTDFFNKANMNESKIVQDKDNLSDPKDVARDGYEALMNNDDKVVSGFTNKVSSTMANITPDEQLAKQFDEQQKPVDRE